MAGRQVNLANPVPYAGCPALSSMMFSVGADADGGFVFEGVPPGRWLIHGYPLAPGTTAAVSDFLPVSECVEVEPGARVDGIELGRLKPGTVKVTGRFLSPVEAPLGDWKLLVNSATLRPIIAKPAPPSGLSVAGQRSWMVDWSETAEAVGIACVERDYPLRVGSDGSFVAHGVLPGEYRLQCVVLGGEGTLAVQRELARRYGLAGGNAAAPKDADELDGRPWSASIQTNVVIRAGNGVAGQVVPIGDFQPKIQR